jgi:hypothetical protein
LQPAGTKADYWFADLTSEIALRRWEAAKGVTETELSSPRTVPALVDRLEHDPSPFIRKDVASRMLTLLAREPLVRSALQASGQAVSCEVRRTGLDIPLAGAAGGKGQHQTVARRMVAWPPASSRTVSAAMTPVTPKAVRPA